MMGRDARPRTGSNRSRSTNAGSWLPLSAALHTEANRAMVEWFGGETSPSRSAVIAVVGRMGRQSGGVGHRSAGSQRSGLLLWSLSKSVLAAAIFRMIDFGQLTLGTHVVDLLPDATVDRAATVGQLLSHTAGVPDYDAWPDYHQAVRERPFAPWPLEIYLERARSIGPVGPAGGQWRYSNIGYLLIRKIIQEVSGLSLPEALRALVFAPLGLTRTSLALIPGDAGDLVFDGSDAESAAYHPGWVAHGVVRSTIEETAALFNGMLGGSLLSGQSLATMSSPIVHVADETSLGRLAWGHGVLLGSGLPVGGVTGHTGAGPGSTTAALRIMNPSGLAITIATAIDDEREHGAAELAIRMAAVILDEREGIRSREGRYPDAT